MIDFKEIRNIADSMNTGYSEFQKIFNNHRNNKDVQKMSKFVDEAFLNIKNHNINDAKALSDKMEQYVKDLKNGNIH